jgi:hypothetical protein
LKAGAVSAFQVAQAHTGDSEQLDCGRARMCVCVNGRLVRFAQRNGYRADTLVISGDFLAEMAAGNGDLSKLSPIDTFLLFARMRTAKTGEIYRFWTVRDFPKKSLHVRLCYSQLYHYMKRSRESERSLALLS